MRSADVDAAKAALEQCFGFLSQCMNCQVCNVGKIPLSIYYE